MSKIGKTIIEYSTDKIEVIKEKGGDYNYLKVIVKGPKGQLECSIRPGVDFTDESGVITVIKTGRNIQSRAFHGLYRSLIANMIEGVTNGYEKKLEIHGVGYRGLVSGNKLELSLGFSHKIEYNIPEGITIVMPDESTLIISGIDKQKVGQVAAEIRELRKPEPYKGKGVRYAGEQVKRKSGKSGS
jgi:large subunit ribosomal protein L6